MPAHTPGTTGARVANLLHPDKVANMLHGDSDSRALGALTLAIARRCLEERDEMLDLLTELVRLNYGQPSGVTVPALDNARALLARLDGVR